MIDFHDIETRLFDRGIVITLDDFMFCLCVVNGMEKYHAYALTKKREEYSKVEKLAGESSFFNKIKKECDVYMQTQNITQLLNEVETIYKQDMQSMALNLDDVDLSAKDLKGIINKLLKSRVDNIDSSSAKEITDLLKIYIDRFMSDDGFDGDFQRHFIQIYPPYEAVCSNCNKEIQVPRGLDFICPECHQKYVFDKDKEMYFPKIDTL